MYLNLGNLVSKHIFISCRLSISNQYDEVIDVRSVPSSTIEHLISDFKETTSCVGVASLKRNYYNALQKLNTANYIFLILLYFSDFVNEGEVSMGSSF